jgi:HEAT repeat-containing protein 5
MSIILPTLLKRASGELEGEKEQTREAIFRETSARLLELAASDQAAFRGIVAGLTAEQRSFMESVILAGRSAAASGKAESGDSEGKEPTIALRMDFGV